MSIVIFLCYTMDRFVHEVKYKQPCLEFELSSLIPFDKATTLGERKL